MTPALNCGIALFLAGWDSAAIEFLERAFEWAVTAQSPAHQQRVALVLCSLYSDAREDSKWDLWLGRATDIVTQNPELSANFDFIIVQISRVLVGEDFEHAHELVERADQAEVFAEGTTRQRWGRALRLFVKARRGSTTEDDENTARGIFGDRVQSMHGFRDLEIAAAASTLAHRHATDAREFVREYLINERTSRRPLSRQLLQALAELKFDVTETPTQSTGSPAARSIRGQLNSR